MGTAMVAVVIGFRLMGGNLGLADGLFVLLLAPEFYLPLRTLGLAYHSRMQGIAAGERIAPLMQLPVPQGYDGTLAAPTAAPAIVLEDVTFGYGEDRGGVSGINLELPAASLTALVGESGSGKTTLARLIVGLTRPESGRITVDGVDLTEISADSWRSALAWVPQKPFFFKGTIRANLLLGCPETADAEIVSALEAAAATGFVSRLAAGLDTELGDRGAGLSGGELRRLALARAFLRKAVLIILDEPTAGLDAENEQLVNQAIGRLAGSRTVLLISHREDTVAMAERIALLVEGSLDRVVSADEFRKIAAGKTCAP
jgi:ATP-binding cassette subfamily C protein CydD